MYTSLALRITPERTPPTFECLNLLRRPGPSGDQVGKTLFLIEDRGMFISEVIRSFDAFDRAIPIKRGHRGNEHPRSARTSRKSMPEGKPVQEAVEGAGVVTQAMCSTGQETQLLRLPPRLRKEPAPVRPGRSHPRRRERSASGSGSPRRRNQSRHGARGRRRTSRASGGSGGP